MVSRIIDIRTPRRAELQDVPKVLESHGRYGHRTLNCVRLLVDVNVIEMVQANFG